MESSHHAQWAAAFTIALAAEPGGLADVASEDIVQRALAAAPRDSVDRTAVASSWAVLTVARQATAWEVCLM